MNKVFKVIWSEARNAYVVVSEIAKNMGSKSCSTKKLLAMLIATGVMTCAGMAPAMASTNLAPEETQIVIGSGATVGEKFWDPDLIAIAIGKSATSTFGGIAVGSGANAAGGVAIGIKTETSTGVAIGYKSKSANRAIAIGSTANAYNPDGGTAQFSIAIGDSTSTVNAYSGVAIGAYAVAGNENAIALGREAKATAENAAAFGRGAEATAKNSIAIGYEAKANVTNATTSEQAVDPANAIAIGYQAEATNANAAAIGYLANASGENAVAFGHNTIVSGKNSIALGNKAEAIGEDATALGNTANAHEVDSTALGAWASTDGGVGATAVGYHSTASAKESTAIGNNSSATITGSVALGSYSVADREVGSTGYLAPDAENIKSDRIWTANKAAVSVGSSTTTRQIINVAAGEFDTDAVNVAQLTKVNKAAQAAKTVIEAGNNVTITSDTDKEDGHTTYTINATDTDTTYTAGNGIKIDANDGNKISVKLKEGDKNLSFDKDGNLSLNLTQAVVYKNDDPTKAIMSTNAGTVAKDATMALGKGANAKKIGSLAIGNSASAEEEYTIAIGEGTTALWDKAIAIGYNSSANYFDAIAVGTQATAHHDSVAIGHEAEADQARSVAIGYKAKTEQTGDSGSIAIGDESYAKGLSSLAIGDSAKVYESGALAIGGNSIAHKSGAVAVGNDVQAYENYAIAIGDSVGAFKASSIAIGQQTYAFKENSIAIGDHAMANANDSVALGNWSFADREAGTVGYLSPSEDYSADDIGKPEVATWKANRGAVSVGAKLTEGDQTVQYTRQITNVAAGKYDTDAVNVAQLKVVEAKADKHTTLVDGKNTTVDPVETEDGHLAYKVNVQGALQDITSISNGSSSITLSNGNVVVNNKVTINSDGKISGVANGTADNDAVNVSQLNALKNKQAVVYVDDNSSKALKSTNAKSVADNAAIALGNRVYSTGENAIAIGGSDKVKDGYSVTEAAGSHSIAIGISAWTPGDYATAVGNNAHAMTYGSVAIGAGSVASRNAGEYVGKYAPDGAAAESAIWKANLGDASVGYHYTKDGVTHYFTRQITHVAAGTEDTDAVNVAQLKTAKTEVAAGNNNVTVVKDKGADGQDIYKISTKDTTYTAGNNVQISDDNVISATDTQYTAGNGITIDSSNNNAISVKLKDGEQNLKVDASGLSLNQNINVNKITTNNAYVTNVDVNNGNSVTNVDYVNQQISGSVLSAGNGIDITNKIVSVKLKEDEKNLVVDASGLSLNQDISVNKVTTNNAYVNNVDVNNSKSVTNVEYVNQKTAAAKSEVAAGTNVASVDKTTAEDGHTVYTVNAEGAKVTGDDNVGVTAVEEADNVTNYKLQLASNLTGINSISNSSGASIHLTNGNVVVNNKVTINSDGKISGVANGAVTSDSTDAVNGSQLYEVQQQAGKHSKVESGTNINVKATNEDGQMVYKVNLNSDILLGEITGKNVSISGTNGTIETTGFIATNDRVYADKGGKLANIDVTGNKISNGSSSIVMDGSNVKVNDKVTIDQGGKISGVADGEISKTSTDAINGSQLNTVKEQVDGIGDRVTKIEGDVTTIKNDITTIKGDITTIKNDVKTNTENIAKNTENIQKLDNRVTEVEKVAKQHTTVAAGDNVTVSEGTNKDGGKEYTVALKKDISLDSVTTGDTVMNNDGLKVGDKVSVTKDAVTAGNTSISNDGLKIGDKTYVNSDGLNANSQKVTNVADGEISATSKDAVNGSQLHATNEQVIDNSNRISKLGNRINKVGAGAAALAALHPMDFDPDDKWSFAAGYGNYAGENAAAIGAYYRPDEKVMFSVGGTVGNGENMVNAGISFALDRTNHVSNSRTALAREVIDLRGQLAEMGAKMAKMEAMLGVIDESKTKLFPDIPANHWAYEYIAKLAGNGILEGYPDGTFGGDRLMTRYEFAAMLYRAIEKGAALEERIINEFAPELGRIRVDRISGKDGDRNKIERVRVNGPRSERDHYGSKLK